MTNTGRAATATTTTTDEQRVANRRTQVDLLQARLEARLRAMQVSVSSGVLAALAHDLLNDAVQIALDWVEPTPARPMSSDAPALRHHFTSALTTASASSFTGTSTSTPLTSL